MQTNSHFQSATIPREIPFGSKLSILLFNPNFFLGVVFAIIGTLTITLISQDINIKSYFILESSLTETKGIVTEVKVASTGKKSGSKSWKIDNSIYSII